MLPVKGIEQNDDMETSNAKKKLKKITLTFEDPDKKNYERKILIQFKHVFCVLKRTVYLRRFF